MPVSGDLRRADAVHLPGADAQRTAILHRHDGVRLHVFDDVPAEIQVLHLPKGASPSSRTYPSQSRPSSPRRGPATSRPPLTLTYRLGSTAPLLHVDCEQTWQVLFRREHFESAFVEFLRAMMISRKTGFHQLGGLLRHRAVQPRYRRRSTPCRLRKLVHASTTSLPVAAPQDSCVSDPRRTARRTRARCSARHWRPEYCCNDNSLPLSCLANASR